MAIKTRNGLHLFPFNTCMYQPLGKQTNKQKTTKQNPNKKFLKTHFKETLIDSWDSLGWIKGQENTDCDSHHWSLSVTIIFLVWGWGFDAAKPRIPLVICMLFKDSWFKSRQGYDSVTNFFFFFFSFNGISKFFNRESCMNAGKI